MSFVITPRKISDASNSKLIHGCKDNPDIQFGRILCNVQDVFKKKNLRTVNVIKEPLDLTKISSLGLMSDLHTSEESFHDDLDESINAKIPTIVDDIHEITLGPNAKPLNDLENETVISHPEIVESKTTLPCQDPKVTSEESHLDEKIRIYLKQECMEKTKLDIPKHISDAINEFNKKQKQEYLSSKKAIEQSVLSDQLRFQNQFARESIVSCDELNVVEKNKTARQSILNALNEFKTKINKQKQNQLEEHLKIEAEKQEQLVVMCKLVTDSNSKFKSLEDIFFNNLKCCCDVARFQREGQNFINFNNKIRLDLNTLVNKCKQASVTRADVENLGKLMSKSQECFDHLSKIHEAIQADVAKIAEKTAATQDQNDSVVIIAEIDLKEKEKTSCDPVNQIIDPSSLAFYKSTSEYYRSVEKQLESLIQNASLKSYRFQCMKAFNIPINAISGLDGRHTLEQYNRLVSVLRGDRELNCGRVSKHPLGVLFCKYSMAKKFVAQVDVKPRVLFAYASVMIELWREFPDFGNLLLGEFHKQCPYLIPVFWPQLEGQSNEDYYKSLGYQYIDDQVEKQDLFLKRMTAMVQMYAAITVSSVRSAGKQPHPHNLQFSWRWIAAMLNLEPQADVSATVIYSYLKIAGNKMAAVYKKQFFKLIQFIQSHYLKRIKQVTPEDQSQQSIAILEELLNKIIKTKHVPPPEGQLPANFW